MHAIGSCQRSECTLFCLLPQREGPLAHDTPNRCWHQVRFLVYHSLLQYNFSTCTECPIGRSYLLLQGMICLVHHRSHPQTCLAYRHPSTVVCTAARHRLPASLALRARPVRWSPLTRGKAVYGISSRRRLLYGLPILAFACQRLGTAQSFLSTHHLPPYTRHVFLR